VRLEVVRHVEEVALGQFVPVGLIVVHPVGGIADTGLEQQLEGVLGHAPVGNHEASRYFSERLVHDGERLLDEPEFGGAREAAMAGRVVVEPVGQDGPARVRPDGVDDARILLAHLGVQADGQWNLHLVEQIEKSPDADTIPVVAPGPVGHLGVLREQRLNRGAGLAPDEVLDGQHGPDGDVGTVGPREWFAIDDGGIRRRLHRFPVSEWTVPRDRYHASGMDLRPSTRQQELITRARGLALERFAPRADTHDRDASFPFDDYADLRAAGLLALCVPERYGGLGADYETYCLVAEQLAQGNASTSLTFNMHCLTMLMMGELADAMPMTAAARERHEKLRAAKFREVIERGVFYGQPHSEPVEQGQTDTRLSMGGRRFGTTAKKVDGGYVVNGRKFFGSLAGSPRYFATPAIRPGDEPWIERTLYLQVPKDAPGVTFPGEWDPMGMRGTVSRDMLLQDVFVPDDGEILPPGGFGAMYNAFPQL